MKSEIHGQHFEAPREIDKGKGLAHPQDLSQYAEDEWGESRKENADVLI